MQRGYVLCNTDLSKVLCFKGDCSGIQLKEVDSTKVLNKAICLSDLTEIKNILRMFKDQELTGDLEIVNVARLYKKFF